VPGRAVIACIAVGILASSAAAGADGSSGGSPVDRAWVSRYDGGELDEADGMTMSPTGDRLYVTGISQGVSTYWDYRTAAYDSATGAELWSSTYDAASETDKAEDMGLSPDGTTLFVTGWSQSGPTFHAEDYATVAYDAATGEQRWVARYDAVHQNDQAFSLAVSPDAERVYVTGWSFGPARSYDYATVSYDAATGEQLWVARYAAPLGGQDVALAVAVSPDGAHLYVTGESPTFEEFGIETLAYATATGAQEWEARYDSGAGRSLVVSDDGTRLFVGGTATGSNGTNDYVALAYDASSGGLLWQFMYDGPDNQDDIEWGIALSPDETQLFLTGASYGLIDFSSDIATVALDAQNGSQRWVARYSGPGNGRNGGGAVAVGLDGRLVYVAGYVEASEAGTDYAVLVYRANSGRVVWHGTYSGPGDGDDYANAIQVSPDQSRWYVTGFIGATTHDWATVAFVR
jgi:PQQ-like domain